MNSSWQKRRSAFNHDWLKNQYMPALAKLLNVIDDKVEDPGFVQAFVTLILPEWEPHYVEVLSILQDCENQLSPRLLFQTSQLSSCDAYTKQWLGDFVHSLWLRKNSIRETIDAAVTTVEEIDATYLTLKGSVRLSDIQSADDLRPARECFGKFRGQCQHLASVIERFPNGIRLT